MWLSWQRRHIWKRQLLKSQRHRWENQWFCRATSMSWNTHGSIQESFVTECYCSLIPKGTCTWQMESCVPLEYQNMGCSIRNQVANEHHSSACSTSGASRRSFWVNWRSVANLEQTHRWFASSITSLTDWTVFGLREVPSTCFQTIDRWQSHPSNRCLSISAHLLPAVALFGRLQCLEFQDHSLYQSTTEAVLIYKPAMRIGY